MIRIYRDKANEKYAFDDAAGFGVGPLHDSEWQDENGQPDPSRIVDIDPISAIPNIPPIEWQAGEWWQVWPDREV